MTKPDGSALEQNTSDQRTLDMDGTIEEEPGFKIETALSTLRYSVSFVTQGKHRFYTFTMPSDVLARTCFVTTRDEDAKLGFQRMLDKNRAEQIADYIDNGLGTIPNSIVLSAQPAAELKIIGNGKTIEFADSPKAFLILDGQHRVYGFMLAKTSLRVPVVVYNGLSRKDESRLFIDINTKQRPVPNELLLDIKNLAEYESDTEAILRSVYDLFNEDPGSPLIGLLSPSERARGKLSRVTFNASMKPLVSMFAEREPEEIYDALSSYLRALIIGLTDISDTNSITNPTIFRAFMKLFNDVAQSVQLKYGKVYSTQNFAEVLKPVLSQVKASQLRSPGNSWTDLHNSLAKAFSRDFTL